MALAVGDGRFGEGLAVELWRRVPMALAAAMSRAMDAHEASHMSTYHAFGSARWRYAGNAHQGLLRVCWGDAALTVDGEFDWQHCEDLPMPAQRVPEP